MHIDILAKYHFKTGDCVMCNFDKDELFFKAKILSTCRLCAIGSRGINKYRYFVRYLGWDNKWDEWLNGESVFPLDEEKITEIPESLRDEFPSKWAQKYT